MTMTFNPDAAANDKKTSDDLQSPVLNSKA